MLMKTPNNSNYKEINTKGAYSGFAGRALNKMFESDMYDIIDSYSLLDEGIQFEPDDEHKGGCIIFSEEVNAITMSQNKIINTIKQKLKTLSNKFHSTKKIDNIAQANELVGWTIGHKLNGRYTAENGQQYGEDSLSLELIGVDFDTLVKVASELCTEFYQESALVKDYSSGRVLFVTPD